MCMPYSRWGVCVCVGGGGGEGAYMCAVSSLSACVHAARRAYVSVYHMITQLLRYCLSELKETKINK